MAFIYLFVPRHLLHLICDVTCYIIFIIRFWLLLHNFRAKIPMKLHTPGDLLSKRQNIFDPVLIMHQQNNFFLSLRRCFFG